MSRIFLIFSLFIFVKCTDSIECGKNLSNNAIVKEGPFIQMKLNVQPFSSDSIMVNAIITNIRNNELAIYKPMLPSDTSRLELFSVLERESYHNVEFIGQDQPDGEEYLKYENGEPSIFLVPKMDTSNFIILQPRQRLVIASNLAHKFKFKRFLKKGQREFKLVYYRFWPYIINGKQVTEIDSSDHQVKPVYFVASLPENDNPDSMRVAFRIP
ncbi:MULTISPECIES: hypothetical protein [Niastella]|uniref:Lipoprotein n=1 Tax=Niastella soli TaxID=2821487 RepID=A0ABS3YZK9_9BACT|nr:hypothetical protein [Niastella soli]MBO9203363.1 hypothetical protein [Niastella soli]